MGGTGIPQSSEAKLVARAVIVFRYLKERQQAGKTKTSSQVIT